MTDEERKQNDSMAQLLQIPKRKRTLIENQVVMNWLRNLARNPTKIEHLK